MTISQTPTATQPTATSRSPTAARRARVGASRTGPNHTGIVPLGRLRPSQGSASAVSLSRGRGVVVLGRHGAEPWALAGPAGSAVPARPGGHAVGAHGRPLHCRPRGIRSAAGAARRRAGSVLGTARPAAYCHTPCTAPQGGRARVRMRAPGRRHGCGESPAGASPQPAMTRPGSPLRSPRCARGRRAAGLSRWRCRPSRGRRGGRRQRPRSDRRSRWQPRRGTARCSSTTSTSRLAAAARAAAVAAGSARSAWSRAARVGHGQGTCRSAGHAVGVSGDGREHSAQITPAGVRCGHGHGCPSVQPWRQTARPVYSGSGRCRCCTQPTNSARSRLVSRTAQTCSDVPRALVAASPALLDLVGGTAGPPCSRGARRLRLVVRPVLLPALGGPQQHPTTKLRHQP